MTVKETCTECGKPNDPKDLLTVEKVPTESERFHLAGGVARVCSSACLAAVNRRWREARAEVRQMREDIRDELAWMGDL